ncbi:hypothetical protein [Burkholderia cepacia]|uniref:hypothetical protein n=1 Tax=Burkholderia cepacia TaxID=292 RepID=UPI00163AA423|nr:hypothetical protein [Burkholderia cepacia]
MIDLAPQQFVGRTANDCPKLIWCIICAIAGSGQRAAGSGQQAAGSRQQAAGSRQQAAGSRQQASVAVQRIQRNTLSDFSENITKRNVGHY